MQSSLSAQPSLTDSLEKILPTKQGKEKLQVLGDLCFYLSTSDVNKAEKFGREALQLAEQLGDSILVASAANDLSTCLYRKGNYDEALALTYRALAIRKKSGDKKSIGSSLNKLVNIYSDQVKLDSALYYGLEAVKIFAELKDTVNQAISLNTIASIYTKERDWPTCLKYAEEAYALASEFGHPYSKAGAAGNIALASQGTGNFDKAIKWYNEALSNFELLESKVDIATVASNLGVLYRGQGDLQKAKASYQKALSISIKIGERNGLAHYNANLGAVNIDLGFFAEAENNFTTALQIAKTENLGRIKLQCYEGLAELYAKTNRALASYQMMEEFKALTDSLYNSEKSEQLTEMRTKYETDKKEQENILLQKEKEAEKRENKFLIFGSIAIIALLSVAGIFYYRAYKRKQEARMQSELVKERERGLVAVFDATENERKRIAKDLHDGIGQQLSGLKLGWESVREKFAVSSPEESSRMKQLTKVLDEAATEVRSISHQMMPKALQEQGLLPAIDDMLRKSLGLTSIQYKFEHFKVEDERFNERIELGLYRICQELVNNIIKHSNATEVMVQFFKNKNNLILMVEDNGKGFNPVSKKEGIGLANITSRLSTVDGEVNWQPSPGSGTVATVRVPIS
ncbi:MAG: sensor histidine kinase [Flavobacteriales bacterium]|nr:sensor histidine kinase [Flavobacteriales bacterium]